PPPAQPGVQLGLRRQRPGAVGPGPCGRRARRRRASPGHLPGPEVQAGRTPSRGWVVADRRPPASNHPRDPGTRPGEVAITRPVLTLPLAALSALLAAPVMAGARDEMLTVHRVRQPCAHALKN